MEDIQELAGNLKAELLHARSEFEHGRMEKESYMRRIDVIRERRLAAQAAYYARCPKAAQNTLALS